MSLLTSLRLLGDPTRVRLLLLLNQEELSVAELQEILAKGQSQISTYLSQLKSAGLVGYRRTGKNIFYHLRRTGGTETAMAPGVIELMHQAVAEIPEALQDRQALDLVLTKRRERTRNYFDNLAGRLGREYQPGRSWQGLAEAMLSLLPPMVIADLGAGEGFFSQLLARRAKQVIAVDSSQKMVEFGAGLAQKRGIENVEYRLGDMEDVPIEDGAVDLAFFSQSLHHAQHPERAIAEAARIVRPGGRVAVLDLLRHQFEEARELYADVWLGFTELELRQMLDAAGFHSVQTRVVHREADAPHFETILAIGEKPALEETMPSDVSQRSAPYNTRGTPTNNATDSSTFSGSD